MLNDTRYVERRNEFLYKSVMNRHFSIVVVMICLFAAACNTNRYFVLNDQLEYVTSFPITAEVTSTPEVLATDAIAIQGIRVFDDYLLISCADSTGCLAVYDKDGKRKAKSFLRVGRGPGEVLYRPFLSWCSFFNVEGHNHLGIYDYKGNYIDYDIDESISSGSSYRSVFESLSMAQGARYFMTGDGTLVCRKVSEMGNGYIRSIIDKDGKEYVNSPMSVLNRFTSEEYNVLSTMIIADSSRGMLAELGSRLNIIHIYSLSGDFCKTISIGEKLENIQEVEKLSDEDMRKVYYDARAYDDVFVALYLNTTFQELDEDAYAPPVLQFFGWDGTPLASVALPIRTLSFDVDFNDQKLYLVDAVTEELLRYDISDILDRIQSI